MGNKEVARLSISKKLFNKNGEQVERVWSTTDTTDPVEAVYKFMDYCKSKGLIVPDIGVFDVIIDDYVQIVVQRVGKLYDMVTIQHPENQGVA